MSNRKELKNVVKTKKLKDILQEKRSTKGVSIKEVTVATKIRGEYIEALEQGRYDAFASAVYAKGLLKNYATYLGLDIEKVLALYRRENESPKANTKRGDSEEEVSTDMRRWLGMVSSRRGIAIASILVLLTILILLFVSQLSALLAPPLLKTNTPVELTAEFDGEIFVPGNSFKIEGETAPLTVVRLNAEPLEVTSDNRFATAEIPFKGEELPLTLTATNQFGRTSTIRLVVKKGSTGVSEVNKMSILIEIIDEATAMLIRTDGTIQFNDRAFPGDVIALDAKQRLQIESDTPYNIKLKINGESYDFTARNQTWELIDGNVIIK